VLYINASMFSFAPIRLAIMFCGRCIAGGVDTRATKLPVFPWLGREDRVVSRDIYILCMSSSFVSRDQSLAHFCGTKYIQIDT
jgi:hypothetical protein